MFVVFEGPKFTKRDVLFNKLKNDLIGKYHIRFTQEPGGTAYGKKISELLKEENASINKLSNTCRVLLEAADRAQHCEYIQSLLDRDIAIATNGFKETSFVHSGYLRGMNSLVYNLNHVATRGLKQDLTILIVCDVDEVYPEGYKYMTKEEYKETYNAYMDLYQEAKDSKEDWILLDISGLSIDEAYEKLLEAFKPYMINLSKMDIESEIKIYRKSINLGE